jgi:secreted trypsin-like serine protease
MKRILLVLATMAAAVLLAAGMASAIAYGQPDGNRHPYVGGVVLADEQGELGELGEFVNCTGTLIAPKVVVTAAHCTWFVGQFGVEFRGVTFDSVYDPGTSRVYPGTLHVHPDWTGPRSLAFNNSFLGVGAFPNDIAVVVLDEEITDIQPASLPRAGLLDQLANDGDLKDQRFTVVGYGVTELTHEPGSGAPVFGEFWTRRYAVSSFMALNQDFLRLSQNPATGDGGACYGDSGGPHFLGAGASETDVVASISGLKGDIRCRAMNQTYRLDTPSARAFLGQYVTLP